MNNHLFDRNPQARDFESQPAVMRENIGNAASYSPPIVLDSITVVSRTRLVDGLALVNQR